VRDEHVAEDMVQEAFIRALKYFGSFRGGEIRPWLLSIVRNTCYTWLQGNKPGEGALEFDEDRDSAAYDAAFGGADNNPEALLLSKQESFRVNFAISSLSPVFREVLVLRELEGLTYEEIAVVTGIPAGTVMSRLARARTMLRAELNCPLIGEGE
jgi:RNA polymerase sigma factor (sigma-70 family)